MAEWGRTAGGGADEGSPDTADRQSATGALPGETSGGTTGPEGVGDPPK
ncbi:hypothetical protein [Streptosporangium sp. KLBMP 9127]|nr:hypothetical protein [Streptosporangium sp. KLBMP 9127]